MALHRRLLGQSGRILTDLEFRILLLVSFTLAWGTPLISPVLDSLTGPYGVSAARIGLFVSVFSAPAIVMIPVTGALADRIGRKPILVGGLTLFGVAGAGIAVITEFDAALVLRLLQGLGWSGIQVTTITSIGDLYADAEEAAAQGMRVATLGISSTVMPVLAGVLVGLDWRYPFLLYALAVPIAVVTVVWFHEPSSIRASDDGRETPVREQIAVLFRFVAQRRVATLLLARTSSGMVFIAFLTYISVLVSRAFGGTPTQAGVLVGVYSVVMAVTATQAGRVTAVVGSRQRVIVGANAVMGAGLVVVAVAPVLLVAAVGSGLMSLGFALLQSVYRSAVTNVAPEELRGGVVSFSESLARVVITSVPVVLGGVIVVLEPVTGPASAVRWALGLTGVTAGVAGITLILVSGASPAATHPSS